MGTGLGNPRRPHFRAHPCRRRNASRCKVKSQPMASAVRLTLSPAEADDWLNLVETARRAGLDLPSRLSAMMSQLSSCAADVRRKQSAKRAEREYVRRLEADRKDRERYFMIGDNYSVIAARADYADTTSDPDNRVWVDLAFQGYLNREIPDQCEIRRNVWLVRVVQLVDRSINSMVGIDCTHTSDPDDIRAVADGLISDWEQRRAAPCRASAA